jgi:uncharacterized membrane protein
MTSFQERFKGKTSKITKEGIISHIENNENPIIKDGNSRIGKLNIKI